MEPASNRLTTDDPTTMAITNAAHIRAYLRTHLDHTVSARPFTHVSAKLAALGALPITQFLHAPLAECEAYCDPPIFARRSSTPTPPPEPEPSYFQRMPSSDAVVTAQNTRMQTVARLHQTCQRVFGCTDALKFEFLEENGANSKQCILTITRPNGTRRSYATEPAFSRKNEAKAEVAMIAIRMGAIDFIVSGGTESAARNKKGLVLAPLDAPPDNWPHEIHASDTRTARDDDPAPTNFHVDHNNNSDGDDEVKDDPFITQIDECCVTWRAGHVKPHWIPLPEPKFEIKHGCALRIRLSPHAYRVYATDTNFSTHTAARRACAALAIKEGVLEYIKHGNGQTSPPPARPPSPSTSHDPARPAPSDTAIPTAHDGDVGPLTLQTFYDALPRPFPEPALDAARSAAEANAPGYVNALLQRARGGKVAVRYVWTRDPALGLHGCLMRLDRLVTPSPTPTPTPTSPSFPPPLPPPPPPAPHAHSEYRTYLVDARFARRADAKAAVCLQALSEGVGAYLRSISADVASRITREMRLFAAPYVLTGASANHAGAIGNVNTNADTNTNASTPRYEFEFSEERDAYGCTLKLWCPDPDPTPSPRLSPALPTPTSLTSPPLPSPTSLHLPSPISPTLSHPPGTTFTDPHPRTPTTTCTYTVPPAYRTKADAQAAVVCLAAAHGALAFLRGAAPRGHPPWAPGPAGFESGSEAGAVGSGSGSGPAYGEAGLLGQGTRGGAPALRLWPRPRQRVPSWGGGGSWEARPPLPPLLPLRVDTARVRRRSGDFDFTHKYGYGYGYTYASAAADKGTGYNDHASHPGRADHEPKRSRGTTSADTDAEAEVGEHDAQGREEEEEGEEAGEITLSPQLSAAPSTSTSASTSASPYGASPSSRGWPPGPDAGVPVRPRRGGYAHARARPHPYAHAHYRARASGGQGQESLQTLGARQRRTSPPPSLPPSPSVPAPPSPPPLSLPAHRPVPSGAVGYAGNAREHAWEHHGHGDGHRHRHRHVRGYWEGGVTSGAGSGSGSDGRGGGQGPTGVLCPAPPLRAAPAAPVLPHAPSQVWPYAPNGPGADALPSSSYYRPPEGAHSYPYAHASQHARYGYASSAPPHPSAQYHHYMGGEPCASHAAPLPLVRHYQHQNPPYEHGPPAPAGAYATYAAAPGIEEPQVPWAYPGLHSDGYPQSYPGPGPARSQSWSEFGGERRHPRRQPHTQQQQQRAHQHPRQYRQHYQHRIQQPHRAQRQQQEQQREPGPAVASGSAAPSEDAERGVQRQTSSTGPDARSASVSGPTSSAPKLSQEATLIAYCKKEGLAAPRFFDRQEEGGEKHVVWVEMGAERLELQGVRYASVGEGRERVARQVLGRLRRGTDKM